MPCFNAAHTLARAAASLIAQTFHDWECIIVDDGSTDGSDTRIRQITDRRFRSFFSSANHGRGAARQFALEHATGAYLSMLDADDWYYPEKLQRQLRRFEADPASVLVGAGVAIVNRDFQLAGIRRSASSATGHRQRNAVDVCFASSMVRAEAAMSTGFNAAYRVAEDADFLLRLLPGTTWSCITEALYAYHEYDTATLQKQLDSIESARRRAASRAGKEPFAPTLVDFSYRAKSMFYRSVFALGLQDRMLRARSERPCESDVLQFRAAWAKVELALQRHVPSERGYLREASSYTLVQHK